MAARGFLLSTSFALVLAACAAAEPPAPGLPSANAGQCQKDTDCKTDRICEQGSCTAPQAKPVEQQPVSSNLGASLPPVSADDEKAALAAAIAGYIQQSKLEAIETSLIESEQFRKLVRGDINGDGLADLAASTLFAIEGSNTDFQHLFVFQQQQGKLVLIDSSAADAGKLADFDIAGGHIQVSYLDYADEDSRCCPSIEYKKQFVAAGDKLVLRN